MIIVHIEDDLSLTALASQLKVSREYLSSQFKKDIGMTLTQYVTARRLGQATYLLETTNLSVQDISVQCGIPNLSYFSKLFREKYGLTPFVYRKSVNPAKH